jgi:short-subunit dehydrogenase
VQEKGLASFDRKRDRQASHRRRRHKKRRETSNEVVCERTLGVRTQVLCPGFTHTEFHDTPELNKLKDETIPGFLWMPADKVIEKSLQALARGKSVYIPGLKNKILAAIPRVPFAGPIIRRIARSHE